MVICVVVVVAVPLVVVVAAPPVVVDVPEKVNGTGRAVALPVGERLAVMDNQMSGLCCV